MLTAEDLTAAEDQVRVNLIACSGAAAAWMGLALFGVQRATCLAFVAMAIGYVAMNLLWIRAVRRGRCVRFGSFVIETYPAVGLTIGIHLLGELGMRAGLLMYLLSTVPGQRRFSGHTVFVSANIAAALFALLNALYWSGWLAERQFWQAPPDGPALRLATVGMTWLMLNAFAVFSEATNRLLAQRAGALVELNRTLADRNARLQRLQAEFEQYASGVAHDLANPLGAAMDGFDALRDAVPIDAGEPTELADIVRRNLGRANAMLAGLRDITRTVAAEESVVDVPLGTLLAGVLAEFELPLRRGGIRVTLPSDAPILRLQPAKMTQAWRNLLGNAIKYVGGTAAPHVAIAYARTVSGHELTIADNGVGIPAEFLPRVFEPFERVPDDRTIATPGMGLGLTLVKRVVEQHGGAISVESSPGRGTRFRMVLPATAAARPAA